MNLSDCPTCEGSGKNQTFTATPNDDQGETWNVQYDPCPDCDGLGRLIPDEWVEAGAKAIHRAIEIEEGWNESEYWQEARRNESRAALAAVLRLIEGSNE